MAEQNAKQRLTDFLDEKAFEPILKARPDNYSDSERKKLEDVQRATESERERYYNYESAEKVVEMFRDDLRSEPAQEIQRELKALDLPSLPDFKDEFEDLASRLGVT